jgi:hypothetical protein
MNYVMSIARARGSHSLRVTSRNFQLPKLPGLVPFIPAAYISSMFNNSDVILVGGVNRALSLPEHNSFGLTCSSLLLTLVTRCFVVTELALNIQSSFLEID